MAYTTIDDPSAHFHTMLYTGNGSTNAITNDANAGDLQPDLLWIKTRSHSSSHRLMDSSRLASGEATLSLRSEDTAAESDIASDGMTSLDSDGFTLNGSGSGGAVNESSKTYVAWQWKANGGSTTTNDTSATGVGDQDSVYQANTTAGFSIVTWTGDNSVGANAHGLGTVPHLMIIRCRSDAEPWEVYHHKNTSAPETDYLRLNTTAATADGLPWGDTAPTSTVFTVGDTGSTNEVSKTYVAYLFSEKQGFSKFGSYTGNGNADGTFVYTGFKPALVITKESGSTGAWYMHDTKRDPSNGATHQLIANTNEVEYDTGSDVNIDILSNGFKQRYAGGSQNGDGDTHIYMAFAEQPFVTSGGVPCTAR
jgi:hypothetical protein